MKGLKICSCVTTFLFGNDALDVTVGTAGLRLGKHTVSEELPALYPVFK